MKSYLFFLIQIIIFSISFSTRAAVILQYHHVSEETPSSTSISPLQFEAHMQYLADNNYRVVPLSDIMNSVKKQQPIPKKTIAITFDDAYLNILTQAKPILDKFDFPFTIFINPAIVSRGLDDYLSWQQLKQMSDDGVIIANHGYEHDSLARIPEDMNKTQWLKKHAELLLLAEKIIEEKTGQSWRYFSYPYGEFSPTIEQWLADHDFIAFSQQSGAVGLATSLTAVPRFPASEPYDQLDSLRDKLQSLPFTMIKETNDTQTVFNANTIKSVTFNIVVDDFHQSSLSCYVSGIGKQTVEWLSDDRFTINFTEDLPVGRVRCNCTAQSISQPGSFYWYSKPWFILKESGEWYPL